MTVKAKTKTQGKELSPEAQLQSYVGKFEPKIQQLFKSVRTALRKRFPTANELVYDYGHSLVIGYSPSDKGIESVVSTATRADGISFYFNHGPQLPDPKGLLKGSAKQVRFIEIDSAKTLAHPDVEALIAASVGLSSAPLPSNGKGSVIVKSDSSRKKPSAKRKK